MNRLKIPNGEPEVVNRIRQCNG